MIFIDNYDSSFWNKSLFSGCIIIILFAALWMMFAQYATSNTWLQEYQLAGDFLRRVIIAYPRFQLIGRTAHNDLKTLYLQAGCQS